MYPYMQPYQNKTSVIRVNGLQGAQTYQMAPGSSALLIDMNNPLVYLCTTDDAGLKSVTTYKIEEYKPEDSSEFKALSDRISKLEEIINESHAKSASRKTKYDADVIES